MMGLRRSSMLFITGAVFAGVIGYTQYRYGSRSSGGGGEQLVGVEVSQLFVTIENRAGQPLFDIRVAIVPVGRATTYTAFEGRLDHLQKRNIGLSSFRGRDGTPFNLRVVKPKSVRVTAKGMNGDVVEVEAPWR